MHRRRRSRHSRCYRRCSLRLLRLVRSRVGLGQAIEEASGGKLACAWTVEEGEAGVVTAGADVLRDEVVVEVRRWPEAGAGPS